MQNLLSKLARTQTGLQMTRCFMNAVLLDDPVETASQEFLAPSLGVAQKQLFAPLLDIYDKMASDKEGERCAHIHITYIEGEKE